MTEYKTADEMRASTNKAIQNDANIKAYLDFAHNAIEIASKCKYNVNIIFKESEAQSNIWRANKIVINYPNNYNTLVPPNSTISFTGINYIRERIESLGYRVGLIDIADLIGYNVREPRTFTMQISWE